MSTSTAGPVACEPRSAFVLAGGAALGAMQAGMVHAGVPEGVRDAPDALGDAHRAGTGLIPVDGGGHRRRQP